MPLIPMQLVMAAAEVRAREHLRMLKLPVIMQLQDQPLPQPPNTIHNGACAPLQAITFGDALLLCSSSMHPRGPHTLNSLQTCVSGTPAAQTPPYPRDSSPLFCTLRSLTLFYPAKFLVDLLNFSQVIAMAGWLHGVCVGECFFVFPLCGFSLSLFCNYFSHVMYPFVKLCDASARCTCQ